MNENKLTCPVCGSESQDERSYGCSVCGNSIAFCNYFAGEQAYKLWYDTQKHNQKKYVKDIFTRQRKKGGRLLVCSDRVALHLPDTNQCLEVNLDTGIQTLKDGIKHVSLSGLYSVYLQEDGTLYSSGDDEYAQCRLGDLRNISSVTTTPKCTYVVLEDGRVISRGVTPYEDELSVIRGVKRVANGAEHLVLLMEDGTVRHIEQNERGPLAIQSKEWRGVKDIAAGAGYTLALKEDGSVFYAGPHDDRSLAAEWTNIVAIAADNVYAIGLTATGKVLLAGKSANVFIDYGRSKAAEWENVCYISAAQSSIAALTYDGELLVTDGINGDEKEIIKFENAVLSLSKNNALSDNNT